MNKIPTAIEFFYKMNPDYSNIPAGFEIVMTEFAKIHVKAALETATQHVSGNGLQSVQEVVNDVLDAYPEELIK